MQTEKIYQAATIRGLAKKATGTIWQGTTSEFALNSDPHDVLCEVDSRQPFGPVSGHAVWVIHVLPGLLAADLAREIWWQLDWSEIAPADGLTQDLRGHLRLCGVDEDSSARCTAVQQLDPDLISDQELITQGWWCRWNVVSR
jgi:hypothetical protein